MENINCPDCKEKQWTLGDVKYVKLFGTGWCCDKKRWEKKELSLEEFEHREKLAVS